MLDYSFGYLLVVLKSCNDLSFKWAERLDIKNTFPFSSSVNLRDNDKSTFALILLDTLLDK